MSPPPGTWCGRSWRKPNAREYKCNEQPQPTCPCPLSKQPSFASPEPAQLHEALVISQPEPARSLAAVAEQDQGRRTAHAEPDGNERRFVDVELADTQPPAVLFRELRDERLERAARRAPGRAKVEQERLLGAEHL